MEERDDQIGELFARVFEAYQSFHTSGYVHRDVKPDNLMLRKVLRQDGTEDYEIVIIDLGTAKEYMTKDEHIEEAKQSTIVGTLIFCSTNVLQLQAYSRRDDIQSVLLTMIGLINKIVLKKDYYHSY